MNHDKFEKAGDQLKSQLRRDETTHDQAIARLKDLHALCSEGAKKFYEAAGMRGSDVYVDMPSQQQVRIRYGFRPGRNKGEVLQGPLATIFVTPKGTTITAQEDGWHHTDYQGPGLTGIPIPDENTEDYITEWLISFLRDAEEAYRCIVY